MTAIIDTTGLAGALRTPPGYPRRQIRDLAALRWLAAAESVILSGPVGVGKTFIACALGHQAIRSGHEVRFAKTSRILADLAGGRDGRRFRGVRRLRCPAGSVSSR